MLLLLAALVLASFCISFISTAAVRNVAPKLGFVDKPGHRKIHHVPKPLGGGVAIFLGIAMPMLVGLAVVHFAWPFVGSWPLLNVAAAHLNGIRSQTPLALLFLLAMLAMHLLGLVDDRKALGPYIKLVIQLTITTLLVVFGDLRALTFLDHLGLWKVPSIVITVLWIAGITNAFNFLDNMDGLSAGVAAICTASFLVTAASIGQLFVAAMLALLLGALIGFLCFNFPPASIFMGDSGSLVIGLALGVLTIRTTYIPVAADGKPLPLGAGWYAVLAPLIVLAVPLYDMIVVSCIRISRGRSPFVGDTNHFSHRLVARGMSRKTAVLCIWLITAATSAAAIILPHVRSPLLAGVIFLQTLMILGVVMLLEQHPLPPTP